MAAVVSVGHVMLPTHAILPPFSVILSVLPNAIENNVGMTPVEDPVEAVLLVRNVTMESVECRICVLGPHLAQTPTLSVILVLALVSAMSTLFLLEGSLVLPEIKRSV